MAGPSAVSPTDKHPRYHLTLSDGTNSVGFIVGRLRGDQFEPDHRALQRTGVERSAIKTREGVSDYSDFDLPWMTINQDDWSGGRGSNDFDKDSSRYFDNYRTIPSDRGILIGPHEVYTRGYRSAESHLDQFGIVAQANSFYAAKLLNTGGVARYLSVKFTASATYTSTGHIELWLRRTGTPNTLTVAVYSDNAGVPGSSLATATLAGGSPALNTWLLYDFSALATTISSGTTYHLVVYAGADNATDYWEIGCDYDSNAAGTFNYSTDGSTWAETYYRVLFRLLDTDADFHGFFFEYKRGWYFVKNPISGANSTLYILGDRGVADSNSGDKTYLEDASKTWTANEWKDAIVFISKGPGSEETQPWRTIAGNDTNSIEVSPDWNVTHTTSTEYVILDTKKWKSVLALGGVVSDVVVAGEFVYFCRGSTAILRYQWYNSGGAEAERNAAETPAAEKGVYINHPDDGPTLYLSQNDDVRYASNVMKALVPPFWDGLMRTKVQLASTDGPWDDPDGASYITNVTHSTSVGNTLITIAAGFTTGYAARKNITSTDIREYNRIYFWIRSDVTASAGDLKFRWEDANASTAFSGDVGSVDIPALAINTWTLVSLTIDPKRSSARDDAAVQALGIFVNTDLGPQNIRLHGGIQLGYSGAINNIDMPDDARVNRIVAYGGSATEPRRNPWVFSESAVYEIQTQNSDAVVQLPIEELATLRSETTGKASGASDVYLMFNLGRRFEKYYSRNLDDIGPDRDEGLPDDRQGSIAAFVSYPGQVFIAIDGGSANYSSILSLHGEGWREIYRAPRTGDRIMAMGVQNIPGVDYQYLWFTQGSSVVYLYVATDPYNVDGFLFGHEGWLESGYIYGNMKSILKAWKSLTVFMEAKDTTLGYVQADYKVNSDTSWTAISGNFDSYPYEEQNLSAATPPSTTGNRLKFRLRMYLEGVNSRINPMRVLATNVNGYGVVPIKHAYTFTAHMSDDYQNRDLEGQTIAAMGFNERSETALAKLDSWASNATLLTMSSAFSVIDNKTVVLNDVPIIPYIFNAVDQVEGHLLQVTVHDV